MTSRANVTSGSLVVPWAADTDGVTSSETANQTQMLGRTARSIRTSYLPVDNDTIPS